MSLPGRTFRRGQLIYLEHVLGLLTPGAEITQHEAHQQEPDPLQGWSAEDRALMIQEGRRQADRQLRDLKEIRGRAQWIFTLGVAITVALAGAFLADRPTGTRLGLFIASLVMLVYGLAGAASIMAVRADFSTIDTAALSKHRPPIEAYLAGAYSRMLRLGENTVATRLTIFRQVVVWVIVGGYVGLIATLM
jgi:hypothetical protein